MAYENNLFGLGVGKITRKMPHGHPVVTPPFAGSSVWFFPNEYYEANMFRNDRVELELFVYFFHKFFHITNI